ncbi:MAG TPA: helicase C-terminal domain-containing protein, partial [Dehalococcoidia bacterium]|nr:helicase C-terminal domain-containing protein [Dehalococcoidia bacterium]
PVLPSHQLGALASALGSSNPTPHRALADALAARDVFLALVDRASGLEYNLLQQLARILQVSDSGWGPLLERLAARAVPSALTTPRATTFKDPPLQRKAHRTQVEEAEVEALLAEDGPFQVVFPAFEERPQQKAMASAVAVTLNQGGQVVLEAGTGVGKSLAYLLPAALFATRNGAPVVISTNTINLQEQLLSKDVPTVRRALQAAGAPVEAASQFRVALLKGRSNYLCRRRWQVLQQSPSSSGIEARFRARLLVWLSQGASGDVGDLSFPNEEPHLWGRVSALADDCSPAACPHLRGNDCCLFIARDRAKAAHLILVNHALLLSDVATESSVLPEYQHLVIDEAHHLEEEATKQWGLRVGEETLARYLAGLVEDLPGGRRTGLVPQVSAYIRRKPAPARAELQEAVQSLEAAVLEARRLAGELFRTLSALVARENAGNGTPRRQAHAAEYERLRLTPQVLGSPSWAAVVRTHEALVRPWMQVEEGLGRLYALLGAGDELGEEASGRRLEGQTLRQDLAALVSQPPDDSVRWIVAEGQGKVQLCSAPLHVGQLLGEHLFSTKESVVLTSATLATEGTFEHLKDRLGLRPTAEVLLGSPFDYKGSALLLVAQDLPEPGQREYQSGLEQSLIELLSATEGRALVLFTSHSALRSVLARIRGPLERKGLLVVGHGVDGSRNQVLEAFKRNKGSVLLGTSSFWEGVDVVGDALSVVVITRLPFQVPSDPVFAARSQALADGFSQYALPLSILRFRQGFGRLIRSRSDRGVVVVLDSRLHRKAYGRAFLQSLPGCTVRVGPARNIPGEASRWLLSFQADLL